MDGVIERYFVRFRFKMTVGCLSNNAVPNGAAFMTN